MFYLAERSAGSNADSNPADFAKNVSTKLWAPTSGIFFPWAQAWSQTSVNPQRGLPRGWPGEGHRFYQPQQRTCAAAASSPGSLMGSVQEGAIFRAQTAPLMSRFSAAPISHKYHEKQRLQSANDRAEITPRATEALLYFCR